MPSAKSHQMQSERMQVGMSTSSILYELFAVGVAKQPLCMSSVLRIYWAKVVYTMAVALLEFHSNRTSK